MLFEEKESEDKFKNQKYYKKEFLLVQDSRINL